KFFVLMACLASIGDSLRRVSKVNNVLQKSNAAAARIFEVMDLPIEKKGWHGRNAPVKGAGVWTDQPATGIPASNGNGNILTTDKDRHSLDYRPRIKLDALQ